MRFKLSFEVGHKDIKEWISIAIPLLVTVSVLLVIYLIVFIK